jgi:hypothetical protein
MINNFKHISSTNAFKQMDATPHASPTTQQQLQILQQLQNMTQGNMSPSNFVPIQGSNSMLRNAVVNKIATITNATNANANASLGFSVPNPIIRNTMTKTASLAVDQFQQQPAQQPAQQQQQQQPQEPAPVESDSNPLTGMVKDVIFAMILNIPALRTKLQVILDNPSLIWVEISKVHDELTAKLTPKELEQLNAYACQDSSRRTIVSVMQTAFVNIMADGKIDMSDAPHFLALIHDCITLFSTDANNSNSVALNSNTVITFLHFVLKCILILTLDGLEEAAALVMLDGSFKLVKLTVMPLIAGKKWCCFC